MVVKRGANRVAIFLAFAALGPVTGPLVAGVLRSWRNGDRILAGLYLAAIPSALTLLSSAAAFSVGQALAKWAPPT